MLSTIRTFQLQCEAPSVGPANMGVTTLMQLLFASFLELSTQEWPPDYGKEYINKGTETFDFIVVGAGTAGSVIAGRLSENPKHRVLLLEAGETPPLESEIPAYWFTLLQSEYDWNYRAISNQKSCLGYPRGECVYPRGKMLSGSSGINVMLYIFGNRRDFTIWEELGNPTWGYDEVLKYYKKAEHYLLPNPYGVHGVYGPLVVDRYRGNTRMKEILIHGAQEAGQPYIDDFRDGHYLGIGLLNALLINGTRNSPAKAFIREPRPNLKIIRNAFVKKINFDNSQLRATSVNFTYGDENTKFMYELEAKNSKEVIISAGVFESPKLLMLSGIGPREDLETLHIPVIHDSPGVGHNFHDHVFTELFFRCDPVEGADAINDIYNYLLDRSGDLASSRLSDVGGFFDIGNRSDLYPNIQTLNYWFSKGSNVDRSPVNPVMMPIVNAALLHSAVLSFYVIVLNPKSRGFVSLKSPDYRHPPAIYPNFLSVDDDIKLLIEAVREIQKLQYTPTYQKYGIQLIEADLPQCTNFDFDTDAYWECYIRYNSNNYYHPVGTAKMGPDVDHTSVVDYRLRVKGVKRVRVVDASVMPTVVSGNTQATTVMIAEKAADFIKEDWSRLPFEV